MKVFEKIKAWIRLHSNAKELAEALYELEDEASIKLWYEQPTPRSQDVVIMAQRALLKSGKGIKGW